MLYYFETKHSCSALQWYNTNTTTVLCLLWEQRIHLGNWKAILVYYGMQFM